jgi:hypothetical protein
MDEPVSMLVLLVMSTTLRACLVASGIARDQRKRRSH